MNKTLLAIGVALLSVIIAQARTSDEIAMEAAAQNPQVKAAAQKCEAFRAESQAENALSGPEAELEYKFGGGDADNRWGVSVGQQFEWPGVYAARSRAAKLRAGAFELDRIAIMRGKWLEAKLVIVRLQQAAALLGVAGEAVENLRRLVDVYDRALSRGETTVLESKKARMQLAQAEIELADAKREHAVAQAVYDALWVESDHVEIPDASAESVPELAPEAVYRQAYLSGNPEFVALQQQADAAAADISVARQSSFPGFKIAYVHDYEEGRHFNGFGVGINLPSWRPGAAVRAAKARREVAVLDKLDADIAARAKITGDYAAAKALHELIRPELCDKEYAALLRKALDAGRITLFQYLMEYNDFLEAERRQIRTVADFTAAEAALRQYVLFDVNTTAR